MSTCRRGSLVVPSSGTAPLCRRRGRRGPVAHAGLRPRLGQLEFWRLFPVPHDVAVGQVLGWLTGLTCVLLEIGERLGVKLVGFGHALRLLPADGEVRIFITWSDGSFTG